MFRKKEELTHNPLKEFTILLKSDTRSHTSILHLVVLMKS